MTGSDVPPVSLTIGSDVGERTFELGRLAKKDAIRIAVGQPGVQSGVWRIWSPKNHSDVYIAARNIAGIQKWSLHTSGDWRHQWCDPRYLDSLDNRSDRIIDQWEQSPELGDTGWTKGLSIYVRHEDVVEMPDIPEQGDVIWLPTPPEGYAVGIHVVIARPDGGRVDVGRMGLTPVVAYTLPNNNTVLVLAGQFEVTPKTVAQNRQLIELALSAMTADMRWTPGLRLTLSGRDEEGGRFARDIAVTEADWVARDFPSPAST